MNNDEAKFILSAYRADGADASDPRFVEAVGQAERDPELATWFQGERRFDALMSGVLEAVPAPRDLRAKILAGGEVSRPRVWSAPRKILALAASIILLAALVGVWMQRAPGLDRWQKDALTMIPRLGTGEARFDLESQDAAALQEWLARQNAPAPSVLPVALKTSSALGCKTITSSGRAVSILCFKMGDGESVHLVVTDENGLAHRPPTRPRFREDDGWRTASWSAGGRAYMLATKGPERELRAVLSTAEVLALLLPLI